MFCPSCGAPNNERDQRYCRECGAPLPAPATAAKSVMPRSPGADLPVAPSSRGRSSALVSAGMKNKLVLGAVSLVVLIVALDLVIKFVIATVVGLILPLAVVIAIGAFAYFWLKGSRRR